MCVQEAKVVLQSAAARQTAVQAHASASSAGQQLLVGTERVLSVLLLVMLTLRFRGGHSVLSCGVCMRLLL